MISLVSCPRPTRPSLFQPVERSGGRGGGLREAGEVFRVVAYYGGPRGESGEGHGPTGAQVLEKGAVLFSQGFDSGVLLVVIVDDCC